ncbi:MAG: efflux RND transporter periplasmic adaptor subunit [Pseudomonadota bacterium]
MTDKKIETEGDADLAEDATSRISATKVLSGTVDVLRWIWQRASIALTFAAIIGAFVLGMRIGDGGDGGAHEGHAHGEAPEKVQIFTCAMHPQIRQDGPGICPICNMELVPVKESGEATGPRELVLSEAARKLAEVETAPAERKAVDVEIRMIGKVDYDETRVKTIAAWLDGRIEKLHADFTGLEVAAGAPLVDLYSPELYVAQKELLLTRAAIGALPESGQEAPAGPPIQMTMLEAAREKLRLWGLSADQIAAIEARGVASETLTIYAPIGGTVVKKQVQEGMYVKEGTPLLTVADLSVVWVQLEAYESDLTWLRTGQRVALSTEAYPGVALEGVLRFIEPFVDPRTRTADIRVEVPNPNGLLKPGMFIRARVSVPIEESDGLYLPSGLEAGLLPLVVPKSAVMLTGKRAVIYVAVPDSDSPRYEGRTVVVGPRAGEYYVIKSGVEEGEEVVVKGNFKIDAALQILAKPSMMSMPSENIEEVIPEKFRQSLEPIYAAYFVVWGGLKEDQAEVAAGGYHTLHEALTGVETRLLTPAKQRAWKTIEEPLMKRSMAAMKESNIEELRRHFEAVSAAALAMERTFGHTGKNSHYEMFCPMAFENRGATWLQESDALLNPYFGASMLRCGEVRETFSSQGADLPALEPAGGGGHQHHGHSSE